MWRVHCGVCNMYFAMYKRVVCFTLCLYVLYVVYAMVCSCSSKNELVFCMNALHEMLHTV